MGTVAYDALAESVRMIESRHVEPVLRLSRRRRFAPMAFDVMGHVAVTMLARRGVGCVWCDIHVLSRRGGDWQILGGGSRSGDDDLLAVRPARLPEFLAYSPDALAGIDPRIMAFDGGGGTREGRGMSDRWPWSGTWIRYVSLRVAADVASLVTEGREVLVPWHGRVVIASDKRRPSSVTIYGGDGQVLGKVRPDVTRA